MNYKEKANQIIKNVGGKENIYSLEKCSTRLRFSIVDNSKVNEEELKNIEGVLGVIDNVQLQIIIGNDVIEYYDEIIKILDLDKNKINGDNTNQSNQAKQSIGKKILGFIIAIFQPLVPAIAGAGVLKSVLILLSTLGIISAENGIYILLNSISDATFYFLPIMVAITTSNKMGTDRLVAVAAVGTLLLPNNIKMISEGFTLMGFEVTNVSYNAQVFPAILTVLFLGVLEKNIAKISPKSIRVFFVPMVSLAITIPLAYLILGPIGYVAGEYLTTGILFLYEKLGFIGIAILAGILPFMIATGMHKAMVPYAISTYGSLGYEMMYLPASLGHNIAESGACFAVSLKSKDKKMKSVAASAGISALMGITEPALYGVTLLNRKVLYSVIIGGAITGGFVGLVGLKAFVIAGPGLANLTMFIDPNNKNNFIYGIIGFIIALLSSFIITLIFWKEEDVELRKEEI